MVYALGSSYIVGPSDKGCNLEIQTATFFRFRPQDELFSCMERFKYPETYLFDMVCLLQVGIFNLFLFMLQADVSLWHGF